MKEKNVTNVKTYGNEKIFKRKTFKLIRNGAAVVLGAAIILTLILNWGKVSNAVTNWSGFFSNAQVSEEIALLMSLTPNEYNQLSFEERQKAILVRYTYVANEVTQIGERDVIEVKSDDFVAYIDPETLKEVVPLGGYTEIDNVPIMVGNRTVLKASADKDGNLQTAYLDTKTLAAVIPLGKYAEIAETINIDGRELLKVSNGLTDKNRLEGYLDSNTLEEVIPLCRKINMHELASNYVLVTLADGSQEIIDITPVVTEENNKKLN